MAFNAKIDIVYSYNDGIAPDEIFINATITDYLGLYFADSVQPGYRILQDVTGWGFAQDILLYEVIENQGSSDGGATHNLRGRWLLPGDTIDLQSGYPATIGEPDETGAIDIPEPASQNMDYISCNRFRNYITRTSRQVSSLQETFPESFDGSNQLFSINEKFRPGSIRAYFNGIRLSEGIEKDYEIINQSSILLAFAPGESDRLTLEYIRS